MTKQNLTLKYCIYEHPKSVIILVPKTKGIGYLKRPAGHHVSKLSTFIDEKFDLDCCGIDGYLRIVFSKYTKHEPIKVVKAISDFLKFDYEEISHEYFFDILDGMNISSW